MHHKRIWGLICSCMPLLATAPAVATESVVVVGTGACDDPTLVDHVRAVRQALIKRVGSSVRTEEQTVAPLGGLPRGSLVGAKALVDEAESDMVSDVPMSRAEYLQRDQRAQEHLRQARDILASIPPSSERASVLLRAHTLELQLFSGTGRQAKLEETLEAILRVLPRFAFDPNTYSPEQLAEYEQVRTKLGAKSRATLKVTTEPSGIVVYVDGLEVGPAPLDLQLPPGTYRVEVASGPHRGLAHLVKLSDWAEVNINAALERTVFLDGGPCVESDSFSDRATKLGLVAALLSADKAVGVRLEKVAGQSRYVVAEAVAATNGPERHGAAMKLVEGRLAPSALDRLWDVLSGSPAVLLDLSQSKAESSLMAAMPAPVPPPRWMRPAMLVTGGLGLTLAGVSVYESVSARSFDRKADRLKSSDGSILSGSQTSYDRYTSDARSARRGMIVSAGAAVVFAGAAGVLWYLAREPEPLVVRF